MVRRACFSCWIVLTLCTTSTAGDEVADDHQQSLQEIRSALSKAGALYRAERWQASAAELSVVRGQLEGLSEVTGLKGSVRPLRESFDRAEGLLKKKGISLSHRPLAKQSTHVSFSAELAETLLERCTRCHGGRLPRRGLRIESYSSLMKGSADQSVVSPGDSSSFMIRKMKGEAEGDRMPPEGQPLDPEIIGKFEDWIREGARFDGSDPELPLADLIAATKRGRLDREVLLQQAVQRAQKRWLLAFPGQPPKIIHTGHVLLVANASREADLKSLETKVAPAFRKVTRQLGVGVFSSIKSPLTIYIIPDRYDYAEFVEMVEQRSLAGRFDYWQPDEGFGYVVLGPRPDDRSITDAVLNRGVCELLLNRWGAPSWYVDGMAQVVFEQSHRRNATIRGWLARAATAIAEIKKSEDLFLGRLPQASFEAATWAFAKYLASDKRRIRSLHTSMAANGTFDESFRAAYGASSKAVCDDWLERHRAGR